MGYFDEQWAGDFSHVSDDLEDTAPPKPSTDAVVHRSSQAWFLCLCGFPCLRLLLRVSCQSPPQTFAGRGLNLAASQLCIVGLGLGLTSFEGIEDFVGNDGRRAVVLQFPEIGCFEWACEAEFHERIKPGEGQIAEKASVHFGSVVGIVNTGFWRRRVDGEEVTFDGSSMHRQYR